MSRRSRRRDTNAISTGSRRPVPFGNVISPLSRVPLIVYEDRRSFNPEGFSAPARSFNTSRHRLDVPRVRKASPSVRKSLRSFSPSLPIAVGFKVPSKVLICVRRKVRKQVLHALKKTGRRGQRSPRFSDYSRIHC